MSDQTNAATRNSATARPARRNPRGSVKSLESLSASMNRALAGARAPQVAAARQAALRRDPNDAGRARAARRTATVAARRRTNFLLGTLDGLRRGGAGSRGLG